jgi:hypothetical protein
MRSDVRGLATFSAAGLAITLLAVAGPASLSAKEKASQTNPNDPTLHLYNLLDSKFNGKLDDFCVLAGVVNDPQNAGQTQQNVLRIEYSKDRAFGKLRIYVRSVAQLSQAQLKTYTPKQIYDFAETDSNKFTKTDPGAFGKPGDLYFALAPDGGALATSPVTPEIQAQYERLVTQYIIPALEKKGSGGNQQ